MKLIKKILLIVVVTIILTAGFTYIKLFHIGSILSVDYAYVVDITVTDESVMLHTTSPNSATAFRGYKHNIEDNNLYIKIYEVLVSKRYKTNHSEIIIVEELSNFENIYISDGQDKKLIWTKK